MRHIQPEEIDLGVLYTQCANRKRILTRQRLTIAQPAILEASQHYRVLGGTMRMFEFVQPEIPPGGANAADLVDLYKTGLARKGGPGRWAYDRIRASAPLGICPLCGQRPVATLDHYLPKESKWTLAITPTNLIPACTDCNFAKWTFCPEEEATQPLHPYFDPVDDAQWLFARLQRQEGLSAIFFAREVVAWTPLRNQRVQNHFELFELKALYGTQAAEELVNTKHRLTSLHESGGPVAVRDHLIEEASSRRRNHINSWQTALYEALSQDQAFCAGDFALI